MVLRVASLTDGKDGRIRSPWRVLLLVVTLACILLSAILWPVTPPSYGDGVWPDTYEEWLYDYLYNSTRLGYDPSVWGGLLIETDNPAEFAYSRNGLSIKRPFVVTL